MGVAAADRDLPPVGSDPLRPGGRAARRTALRPSTGRGGDVRELTVSTAEEMRALGERLAALLRAGDLMVLTGELGAGKTTLVQGIAAGLGATGPCCHRRSSSPGSTGTAVCRLCTWTRTDLVPGSRSTTSTST